MSAEDEKKVKLAAKELYHTLIAKKNELFIVGWQNDPQPKARVRKEIDNILNLFLPESYGIDVFRQKSNDIYEHIVDQAITGFRWVA